jgi:O-antigen/teichoic acid export membrane protein
MESNPESDLTIKSRLQFLLQDTALYGGAAAISKAFSLLTFPLLARHLSIEDYGIVDYFFVLGGLLAIFLIFGQDSSVARFYYEHEDSESRKQLISQSLIFQLAGVVLFLPLLWLYSDYLIGLLISATNHVGLFKIVLLQLPFLLLINFSQNLLKWTFSRTRFLIMSLGGTFVQVSLLLVALLYFDVGIEGVLLVSLASSAIFGALGLFFVRKWLTVPTQFNHLRKMLPFAIPYGVICIAGAFSPTLERTLTISLLGIESLGLYAVGVKIAMLMGMLASAFQTAWGPFSLSLYKRDDSINIYNWVLKLFAITVCVAVLTLTLIAQPVIVLLTTERFLGAEVVVFPLAMGLAIQATSWITEMGISISKRSYLSLYAYLVEILVTLAVIFLCAPLFGLFGVAFGVLSGQIVKAVTASWLAQKAYPLAWQYFPVAILMFFTTVSGLASIWMAKNFGLFVGNLMIVGAIFLVIGVGWRILFSQAEQKRLLDIMSSYLQRIRFSFMD